MTDGSPSERFDGEVPTRLPLRLTGLQVAVTGFIVVILVVVEVMLLTSQRSVERDTSALIEESFILTDLSSLHREVARTASRIATITADASAEQLVDITQRIGFIDRQMVVADGVARSSSLGVSLDPWIQEWSGARSVVEDWVDDGGPADGADDAARVLFELETAMEQVIDQSEIAFHNLPQRALDQSSRQGRFARVLAAVLLPAGLLLGLVSRRAARKNYAAAYDRLLTVSDERREAEDLLRQSRDQQSRERNFLDALLDNLAEGILACDANGDLILANASVAALYDLPEGAEPDRWTEHYELIDVEGHTVAAQDHPLMRALNGDRVRDLQLTLVRRNGDELSLNVNGQAIFGADGTKLGAVVVMHDVSARRRAEENLRKQALHDALTGLPNRTLLVEHLNGAMARARRHDRSVGLLFLDLDRFKIINDSLGHDAGDELLMSVSERIEAALREGDLAARLGGDEFVIVLEDLPGDQAGARGRAIEVAERLERALAAPYRIATRQMFVTASIGITVSRGFDAPDALLGDADAAMYIAKDAGKNRYAVFDDDMRTKVNARLEVEHDLYRALQRSEFVLEFQPIVDAHTGRTDSVESLIRWDHPRRGRIPPVEFLAISEEIGLITDIGSWVIDEACRSLAELDGRFGGDAGVKVAVNLSGRQLQYAGWSDNVLEILAHRQLAPSRLCLEITESVIVEADALMVAQLEELRSAGVSIALDDFGTGFSSLSHLRDLPVDQLKIDRTFVTGMSSTDEDAAIVEAVLGLGRAMGAAVVAEGVEDLAQLEMMRNRGCDLVQGFHTGRPVGLAAVAERLRLEHAGGVAYAGYPTSSGPTGA